LHFEGKIWHLVRAILVSTVISYRPN